MSIEAQSERVRTPSEQREIERKYDIPEGAGEPELSKLGAGLRAGRATTETLVAEYVDTPELAILDARCVLRRRTGGDDEGWHLKRPRSGDERIEVHAPVGAPRRIPPELRVEFAELIGERPVLPLVELTTIRTTTEVLGGGAWSAGGARADDDALAALICEDVVRARVLRIGDERTLEWREFEVELADGASTRVFDEIEAVLFDAGLTPSVHLSKLVRTLDGVEAAQAPTGQATAGEAVVFAIAARFGEFQAHEDGGRRDAPDAVHQARVALRRLRSLLKVFGSLFEADEVKLLAAELKWAGGVLGAPRDAEVLRELVLAELDADDELDAGPEAVQRVRTRIEQVLEERHAAALASFGAEVDSDRWDSLHDRLVSFITAPPFTDDADRRALGAMRRLTRTAIVTVEQRAERARKKPRKLERWHDVRKAAKSVRYGYEAIDELPDAKAKKQRKEWKRLAQAFGELQDAAMLDAELAVIIQNLDADHEREHGGTGAETVAVLEEVRERVRRRRGEDLDTARDALDNVT
ncbi:CYTH and CHAD domain-containing protein [Pseudoclavibacter sp. RFBA6]|uniref:CYTH and CHAD domain-containing protein n=1 Tax=Pseudoclavibacter sp. RFBA6 TaxID=2080573 RepID=UPI000CE8ADCF|nr:CYTH and CHAD domain-containing protein [Pseudoclavibacter sp. RFBA6]PPG43180.1 hypothetical protein C5C17_01015 [Pseudoclavibacter sp. RFBA6]